MIERTHYVELGVNENAGVSEIRAAYRKLVLLYHPDRSGDKGTTARFVKISEAYRTLSDPKLRTEYDIGLKYRRDRAAQKSAPPANTTATNNSKRDGPAPRVVGDEAAKVQQAAAYFSSGKYDQAESILRLVLRTTPSDALAHAILGDIGRQRGDLRQALTQYSYAVQFAPNNTSYQRRYEELLDQSSRVSKHGYVEAKKPKTAPLVVSAMLVCLMAIIVSVSPDRPLFPDVELIDTYTFTYVLLSFLSGITLGVATSIGGFVDRLRSLLVGVSGRLSPFAIVSGLSLFSFWLGTLVYFSTGLTKDAFTYSASRMFGIVSAACILFSLCAWISGVHPIQSLCWGANLIWMGALCGWAIADGFR
jgi:curved DNA-binding protein CbpA